jgi:hypothetical protein
MKAVRGKDNSVCLISSTEARLFNKVVQEKFLSVSACDEREAYLLNDLHIKNVLNKVQRGEYTGYETYKKQEN